MGIKRKRTTKLAIAAIAVILASQAIMYSLGAYDSSDNEASAQVVSGNDLATAAEISNLTGETTESILKMKASGQSWNAILEQLKGGDSAEERKDKAARGMLLMETGLSEDTVQHLKAEGYAEEEIWSARLLVERAAMQMKELAESADSTTQSPKPEVPTAALHDIEDKDKEQFLEELRNIAAQFDLDTAIKLLLALKDDFGSYEAVLDEYLLSLQWGLDLEVYKKDKDAYEQDKTNKSSEFVNQVTVTLAEIESRLLEESRNNNESMKDQTLAINPLASGKSEQSGDAKNPLPEVPMPQVEDVKPRNPADVIQEELNRMNPNVTIPG